MGENNILQNKLLDKSYDDLMTWVLKLLLLRTVDGQSSFPAGLEKLTRCSAIGVVTNVLSASRLLCF